MLQYSFPLGRFLGIDLRMQVFFPLILAFTVGYSLITTHSAMRGIGLWLALLFAVVVRETARAIAVAWSGLRLKALFLLPFGGVMALVQRAPTSTSGPASLPGPVTLVAPIANFAVGLLMIALCYAIDPHVPLLSQPWISPAHILRSMIWCQFLIAIINLLPTSTLPATQLFRKPAQNRRADDPKPPEKSPAAPSPVAATAANLRTQALSRFNFRTALGLALIVMGIFVMASSSVMLGLWPVLAGAFILLNSQLRAGQARNETEGEAILIGDVMLTEFTMLSSSDTLQGALARTIHSLQDVFPVVRGDRLVGSISRQTLTENLQTNGDSYLQGVMTRNLQLAAPTETVVTALRRAAALGASEFIPVVEGAAMLGILTPQSLSRAVHQVKQNRVSRESQERE